MYEVVGGTAKIIARWAMLRDCPCRREDVHGLQANLQRSNAWILR
jgi:hypothetical protein